MVVVPYSSWLSMGQIPRSSDMVTRPAVKVNLKRKDPHVLARAPDTHSPLPRTTRTVPDT